MNNRTIQLLKIDTAKYLKSFSGVVAVWLGLYLILPNVVSLIINGSWEGFDLALSGAASLALELTLFLLIISTEFSIKFKLQNGFTRTQIFNNDLLVVLWLTILVTIIQVTCNYKGFTSSKYANFFDNPGLSWMLLLIISFLTNYLVIELGEFMGIFISRVSKKMQKWVLLAFAFGFVIATLLLAGVTAFGITKLLEAHVITQAGLEDIVNMSLSLLIGYQDHGAYDPLNLIVTLLVLSLGITGLTKLVTSRIQLQRGQ